MTMQTALNGCNAILAIIQKGHADPATKLAAIADLVEAVRSDIRDLADAEYSNYLAAPAKPTFDMEKAVADLAEQLRKQIYYNLYSYYHAQTFMDEEDPFVRVAIAKALLLVAVENEKEPNPVWLAVIQNDGELNEVDE